MHAGAGVAGEQRVAGDDRLLGGARPAGEPEPGGGGALVRDGADGQPRLLRMLRDENAERAEYSSARRMISGS